jgi:hypothetical protein
VPACGGTATDLIRTKGFSLFPRFLPDGHDFLYVDLGISAEQDGIYLASLDGKENRRVLRDVSAAVVVAGRLLFIRENTLMAQEFDATSGRAVGEASSVAPGVSFSGSFGARFTVSETGALLYQISKRRQCRRQLSGTIAVASSSEPWVLPVGFLHLRFHRMQDRFYLTVLQPCRGRILG